MQISGIVKEIYEGTTKTGRSVGKPFWSITLDTDQKLTAFESNYIEGVKEGGEYTFTFESDGKYANLTAPSVPVINVDSETTSPDSTTAPLVDEVPKRDTGTPVMRVVSSKDDHPKDKYGIKVPAGTNKDLAIRKAVALKAAVEYVASVLGGTGTTADVISYAREFEEYLK